MGDVLHGTGRHDAFLTTSKDRNSDANAGLALNGGKEESVAGKTVTIRRPRRELYDCWRNFSNLPLFMDNVVSVDDLGSNRSHWVVRAPGNTTVEWTSIITEDDPGKRIAWTSEEGADVPNSGRIEFQDAPGGRATWVSATILYDPPSGIIGKAIAKIFQREPAIQAHRDLRRFKQLMETGEVATAARARQQLEEEKA